MASTSSPVPRGTFAGFRQHFVADITAGFLVFLIALPLCLGISLACGYPPIAGIFTAILGGVLTTFISNSELTIKGPAAGLIVIAIGCIQDFGGDGVVGGFSDADMAAYRAALAVGVAAAVLQIVFGALRAGILGEFFPLSAVHGMLAAIGVIIILKQFPVALGSSAAGEPLELLKELPATVAHANPAIALIGVVSLIILFAWPELAKRVPFLGRVPAPLVVVLVSVPLGMFFHLTEDSSYTFAGHEYELGSRFLVTMPDRVFGMFDEITFPNFAALAEPKAWKWVMLFFVIGSLESLLSAKAVDLIDPWKRKTDLDRDVLAVGVANLAAAMIGGLPMISEIVRSRANIDNGARTRFADMWHGLFLLVCVALIPMALHLIPLAALAAMLVYTGYRLAHPSEFISVYRIGPEQLVVFASTVIGVLATDLLIGILIGIGMKFAIHIANGVPLSSLFQTYLAVEPRDDGTCVVRAARSAVFSNWIPFRRQIEDIGLVKRQNIVLDLSDTVMVDHSVMEKLHQLQEDFEHEGLSLEIVGLEDHMPISGHKLAARRGGLVAAQRLMLIVEADMGNAVAEDLERLGALTVTRTACESDLPGLPPGQVVACTQLEAVVSAELGERLVRYVRQDVIPKRPAILHVDAIRVVRREILGPTTGPEQPPVAEVTVDGDGT